jgi:predicted RNase H-like HicB family nuclease
MNGVEVIRTGKLGTEIYVRDPKQGGFTGFFKDFPNIITEGETIDEAQKNLWNTIYDVLKYHIK